MQRFPLDVFGKVFFFVALSVIWLNPGGAIGGETLEDEAGPPRSDVQTSRDGSKFNLGAWFASSVWKHISAVDGDKCPSEPTCSSYSAQAFRKHGFFVGWVMTVDRLIHEADEGSFAPLVKKDGQIKILDPVEDNDFWWHSKDGTKRD